jgi:hypothetical protein
MSWLKIRIDSESDRATMVAILARNGYEVRERKVKVNSRYERYVEYRERVEDDE